MTETPELARALDLAANRWPSEPRSRLLLRLVAAGSAALDAEQTVTADERRAVIDRMSGTYVDEFGGDFLADLRADWPERSSSTQAS